MSAGSVDADRKGGWASEDAGSVPSGHTRLHRSRHVGNSEQLNRKPGSGTRRPGFKSHFLL